ncbi:class I SAM-dependent methyltransferase [Candidatus Woesearchaeota archaeon]|nr:class I SAM-dependent methyltransferase [Candidatus Woesearchaeota archaeon]
MEDYYKKRASEYEEIYCRDDPVRMKELKKIGQEIKRLFKNKEVLEVAAGTGYWSRIASLSAAKIVVTDAVEETLGLAKAKHYSCPVEFRKEDAYNLSFADNSFSGGLANFWFSHIPREKIYQFLKGFHRVLMEKAIVFIGDNNFDKNVGGRLIRPKGSENTYKIRSLRDGKGYKILKNYFSKKELFGIFKISFSTSVFHWWSAARILSCGK